MSSSATSTTLQLSPDSTFRYELLRVLGGIARCCADFGEVLDVAAVSCRAISKAGFEEFDAQALRYPRRPRPKERRNRKWRSGDCTSVQRTAHRQTIVGHGPFVMNSEVEIR